MDKKSNYDLAREILNPFLKSYVQKLFDELEEINIIKKIKSSPNDIQKYQLLQQIKFREKAIESKESTFQINESFKEFKKVLTNIYINTELNHSSNTSDIPFYKIIEELNDNKILIIPNYDKTPLKDIFSLDDRNIDDIDIAQRIEKIFIETKFNFKEYTKSIIVYFLKKKIFEYLNHFDIYEDPTIFLEEVDIYFIGKNKSENTPSLLFEIKFISSASNSLKEIIFQSYELLKKYEHLTKQNSRIIIIMVTDDSYANFPKLIFKFNQDISELFPDYLGKITLIPVDKLNFHLISKDMNRVNFYDSILFSDSPRIVRPTKDIYSNANFLKSETGTFSVWIKLGPLQNYHNSDMNFEYIISHASNDYHSIAGDYSDVFSISLASDKSGKGVTRSNSIHWRFWISNSQRENFYLKGPSLDLNSRNSWHNIIVRWDHKKPILELIINGVTCAHNNYEYVHFWPKMFLDKLTVGTWGNKANVHYIGLPLYRLITVSKYLDDNWVKNELNNLPVG